MLPVCRGRRCLTEKGTKILLWPNVERSHPLGSPTTIFCSFFITITTTMEHVVQRDLGNDAYKTAGMYESAGEVVFFQ
jgi:hypothetical protein